MEHTPELSPDEWADLLLPPSQRLVVRSFHVTVLSTVDEPATEAGIVFDVEHLETHTKWRQLNLVPIALVQPITLALIAICQSLGIEISQETTWQNDSGDSAV